MTGAELFDIRAGLGLTQVDMGALFGVHSATILKWEHTEDVPLSEFSDGLCKAISTLLAASTSEEKERIRERVSELLVKEGSIGAVHFLLHEFYAKTGGTDG